MRKALLVPLAALGLAGAAFAVSNTGAPEGGPIGAHVLTPPGEGATAVSILYAPSEADDATYRAAIAAITGGTVDYFDARAGTPDATLLANYDCVHTWANYSYSDNVLFGDRLADFVDTGGTVVLGAFATYTSGNYLSGRIMTSGYSPVVSPGGTNHFSTGNYAGDGTSYIHDGVVAYSSFYRDILQLQGGGIQDGSYVEDAEIAQAYRADGLVAYSNGSGASQLPPNSGDWPLLIANACAPVTYAPPVIQAIPTASAVGLGTLALALAASALWIRRRRMAR